MSRNDLTRRTMFKGLAAGAAGLGALRAADVAMVSPAQAVPLTSKVLRVAQIGGSFTEIHGKKYAAAPFTARMPP